ncbi:hypothetical protein [Streptomyces palmae]|uniref:Uncharacterized protein n=1 Tax=Streptomyces palmae TaxID=1701085 RepID=A0A4Z0HIE7_9ACTN|nr:hypothetical protein [Streptomyces palmae]TGB17589.1 hypothetical protein E4099_03285 [Streptomyces palmae]
MGDGKTQFGKGFAKEVKTLKGFKSRIDDVLLKFADSPGAKKNLDSHGVPTTAFGSSSFNAAGILAGHVEKAHARLSELSQILGDQIEALGIAAVIAENNYEGVDAEQSARLKAIQERAERYYQGHRDNPAAVTPDNPICSPSDQGKSGESPATGNDTDGKE